MSTGGDIHFAMGPVAPADFFAFDAFPKKADTDIHSEWPWGRFGGDLPEWRHMPE